MKKSIYSEKHDCLRALLVEERKKAGVTQAELATKLNRHQSFVAKYESGERRIDVIELLEILSVLNVQPEMFIKRLLKSESRRHVI